MENENSLHSVSNAPSRCALLLRPRQQWKKCRINKGIHNKIEDFLSSNPTLTTIKPKGKWNISVDVNGEDKLTDHKDFGLDFEALNITNVLVQDFILVRSQEFLHYY